MTQARSTAADAVAGTGKATETLSQFVARVLDQLSLSAWLPSAALVLALMFVLELGATLDGAATADAGSVVAATAKSLARISLGGALLLIVAIVVLTMVTQAFSFEAIRVLEGYWGTNPAVEAVAAMRARAFHGRRSGFEKRRKDLKEQAWLGARQEIERLQAHAVEQNRSSDVRSWTPSMLSYLGAKLCERATDVELDQGARLTALAIPWERYAPPDLLRRLVNIDRRLRDFPVKGRELPTRLGNVLRAHEDQTRRDRVETMVLEVYEALDPILRRQHDEHRNRLDLYCSMVFVVASIAIVAVARLVGDHPVWAAASALLLAMLAWLTYRAAVASARVYGLLIVEIARRYPAPA